MGIIFAGEWASVVSIVEGLAGFAAIFGFLYHFLECQQPGCKRPGLHPHKHLRLCAEHHPAIDGDAVTEEHINTVS